MWLHSILKIALLNPNLSDTKSGIIETSLQIPQAIQQYRDAISCVGYNRYTCNIFTRSLCQLQRCITPLWATFTYSPTEAYLYL